ncbi:MAG: hypothetical protein ACXIUD_15350 [Mongoliitalea sp.]
MNTLKSINFITQSAIELAITSIIISVFVLIRHMTQRKKSMDSAYQGMIMSDENFKKFMIGEKNKEQSAISLSKTQEI